MGNKVRRDDKEIKDPEGIRDILKKGLVCHVAMVDDGKPYMVAMNYGFRDDTIYLHAAIEGRKIDILRKNPDAVKFDTISYIDVLNKNLRVLDTTAISFCMENNLKIGVVNLLKEGHLQKFINGEAIGSIVSE